MDHDKTSCLCIFGEKKSIYQRGQAVLFFKLLTNTYTFYRCNKLEQHCARRQAERSYARCKYQHMWLQLERLKWVIPRSLINN